MARPRDLVPGDCYFLLNYFDSNLVIPGIQTLSYVGTEKDDSGETRWLFRECIAEPESLDSQPTVEKPPLVGFSSDSLYQILELKDLIRELGGLVDFHPLSWTANHADLSPRRAECPELRTVIDRLLASPVGTSVTTTIEFTDDGFSMQKEQGTVKFSHFISSKTEREQETVVRRIFQEQGIAPTDDYLSDNGKTHVLLFRVEDEPTTLMAIGNRIFCEVYSMRMNDSIRAQFREPIKR
jgi:hypothetical protein